MFASGTRVKVSATGRVTRPDVAVVCGPVETDREDPDALVNPTLLVAVARAGCGEDARWEHCQRIASLWGYLRVATRSPRLELYARAGGPGVWTYMQALAGDRVVLPVGEACLAVDDVYADLTPLGT